MAMSTISPVTQQRIAVLVPIIALVLSLFVVYPAYGRYTETREKIEKKKAELNTLRNTPLPPRGQGQPTAVDTPSEPPQFSSQISAIASAARCDIAAWDLSLKEAAADKESPIQARRAKFEIDADYPRIRAFLVELARYPRLFVVTDVEISALRAAATPTAPVVQAGLLHATIEIERYVAPPETASAKPAG